jgi:hypothetical protein
MTATGAGARHRSRSVGRVLALVIVLVVTNLVTALLLLLRLRRGPVSGDEAEVFEAPRPPGMRDRDRRLLTIEVLNPLELATARGGRIAGLAGSIAPGLTRRIVYDQVFKILRRELDRMGVHADVRLHTLRPVPRSRPTPRPDDRVVDALVVDEVAPLDLGPDYRGEE